MGSSSPDQVKTTQSSQPWSQQIPYLTDIMSQAKTLYNSSGPQYYPYATTAPVAPETTSGWNAQAARAAAGSPVNRAAQGYATDVLSGDYLGNNPALAGVDQAIWNQVAPRTQALFSAGGRYGPNAAFGNAIGSAYADAIAPFHYQDYEAERGRMDSAAAGAPALAGTDYQDIAAMLNVGQQRQGQAQSEINAAQDRWAYGQQLPWNKLGQYQQLVSGNYGGTTTGSQPVYQPNPWAQVAGSALGVGGALLGLA